MKRITVLIIADHFHGKHSDARHPDCPQCAVDAGAKRKVKVENYG